MKSQIENAQIFIENSEKEFEIVKEENLELRG